VRVTAWNNGNHNSTGAGYGLKVNGRDRDAHFRRDWSEVLIELPTGPSIKVSVDKESFWGDACRELISKEIGIWFLDAKLAPWPKGNPPKLDLEPLNGNRFRLR
jgi:hypothetical protein